MLKPSFLSLQFIHGHMDHLYNKYGLIYYFIFKLLLLKAGKIEKQILEKMWLARTKPDVIKAIVK